MKLLALELGKKLDRETLELGSIEDLIQHISAEAYEHRAGRISRYLGEHDAKKNEERLRAVFRQAAGVEGKGRRSRRRASPSSRRCWSASCSASSSPRTRPSRSRSR